MLKQFIFFLFVFFKKNASKFNLQVELQFPDGSSINKFLDLPRSMNIYIYVADSFNPTYKVGCCNWIESNLVTKYATGSMFGFMKHIVWSFVISH